MMRLLYIDNYRGFKDTYIPIKAVNFLVGENSTGKTSILYLIKLLGSLEFWLNQDFNSEDVNLGHFKDIVSANSENGRYFRVGVIEYDEAGFSSDRMNIAKDGGLWERPLIMLIDEFDTLPTALIDMLVAQFRELYIRPHANWLHGLALTQRTVTAYQGFCQAVVYRGNKGGEATRSIVYLFLQHLSKLPRPYATYSLSLCR